MKYAMGEGEEILSHCRSQTRVEMTEFLAAIPDLAGRGRNHPLQKWIASDASVVIALYNIRDRQFRA